MGHHNHFRNDAPKMSPICRLKYAQDRFWNETDRLSAWPQCGARPGILAGEISIADFAGWPWIAVYKSQGQDLENFPALNRWVGGAAGGRASVAGKWVRAAKRPAQGRRTPKRRGRSFRPEGAH